MEKDKKDLRAAETAQVLVALFLIASLFLHGNIRILKVALVIALLSLITRAPFRPLSRFWFYLAEALGAVMTKILLSIIYFAILTPISVLYRLTHKNALTLRRTEGSLFKDRNESFSKKDFIHPY